jgi:RNA polymerase sigma factor (sigma-70 family)
LTQNALYIYKGNNEKRISLVHPIPFADMKDRRDRIKIKEFEEVLDKFAHFIFFHIQKYSPQQKGIDPDDVFQDVKIKIWKILNDEKKIDNYASYIKKIVDSSVIDQIRRMRREEHILFSEMQKRISEKRNIYKRDDFDEQKLKAVLEQAVDSLLESRRKAVKLYLLNMNLEEISELFSWSRHKTRNLLYRGLKDLKQRLKERGIDYEDPP